jgi:hypothetical protein
MLLLCLFHVLATASFNLYISNSSNIHPKIIYARYR